MTTYQVAIGHNQGSALADIVPQCWSPGIKPVLRTYGASGKVSDQGLHVELIFTSLGSAAQYQAVLEQFGLDDSKDENVTVNVRDDQFLWVIKNGKAIRPVPGEDINWEMPFPKDITILVRNLHDVQ